jgi:AAA family ATP:ADP antiporter
MSRSLLQGLLRPFGQIRESEASSAFLMFSYSFLAMTAYNIIQPIQRTLYIEKLGAARIPYVQLAAGIVIGMIMTGYSWLMSRLPRRWSLPIAQGGIAALLIMFWFLFQSGRQWVSAALYVFGLILGILLISQFWTLANVIYEPRQAKRLFGFIGGGASLGGLLGAAITWFSTKVGTVNLLLVSALFMVGCMAVVICIIRSGQASDDAIMAAAVEGEGVGLRRALALLGQSKHLRFIALVISLGAISAAIIDQQLNMATQAFRGQGGVDAMTAFLGQIRVWISAVGFVIQVALTGQLQRRLGVGFALLLLPVALGSTALIILFNAVLWAPAFARTLDQSLRYTVDRTSREILYMPLADEVKFEAKPFVDVTLDRIARGLAAVLMLVLISPWGFHVGWQKLSYLSIVIISLWIVAAVWAKRGYQAAFREGLQSQKIKPAQVRIAVADLSTIEALIQELASPDERRVLYAMDMLESLDKRNLITPLLLYHESPAVRVRALGVLGGAFSNEASRWLPLIQRLMADEDPDVRAAAVAALANVQDQQVANLARPYLRDENPRIAMTAAMVLSCSSHEEDVAAAEEVLKELLSDTEDSAIQVRREFPIALRHIDRPHFRRLLIPLLHDSDPEVAWEAMRTVRRLGTADFIFIPTLISLLRDRRLKSSARELLVASGEQALGILDHFLRDPEEDIWVRRALPGTIARIPCQQAMNILVAALRDADGILRFKVLAAAERLHRGHSQLSYDHDQIESLALEEGERCQSYLLCYRRIFDQEPLLEDTLLAHALNEKIWRSVDRTYRYLGLLYPWKDIAAARFSVERGDSRPRAMALEYLDNLLSGALRKQLMPVLEDPAARGDSHASGILGKGIRGRTEEYVLKLINDPDPVLSASAVFFVQQAGLGGLCGDLEELLRTKGGRQWVVAEAASGVLSGLRLHLDERVSPWTPSVPSVEVAEKLRRFPLFASLSVDGLFGIARAGSQVRFESHQVLCHEGVVPESLYLLLGGRVSCRSSVCPPREIDAPAALGFQEVMESQLMKETLRAGETAMCLVLGGEELRTLLADDTELIQGLFRMLSGGEHGKPGVSVWHANHEVTPARVQQSHMEPVERILLLSSLPVFAAVSQEEMLHLASIAVEVRLEAGATLFEEADPPAIWVIASGEILLEASSTEPALQGGPRNAVGIQHTFAGINLGQRARVVHDGCALRIDREDLFDLMSQRPDLLRQLFGSMSKVHAKQAVATA